MRATAAFLIALVLGLGAAACDDSDVSDSDRNAWKSWAEGYVDAVCGHASDCDAGVTSSHTCVEAGYHAADEASCTAAVEFYRSHRDELEACTDPYPDECSVALDEACPLIEDHPFESLCD